MKITFRINYHTSWGEALYLCGSLPSIGSGNPDVARRMVCDGDEWSLTLEVASDKSDFSYFYIVKNEEGSVVRREWGEPRMLATGRSLSDLLIADAWHDVPGDLPLRSSAFTGGFMARSCRDTSPLLGPSTVRLLLSAPRIEPWQTVVLTGAPQYLGAWDPEKGIRLNDSHFPVWEANFSLPSKVPFEYKFVIVDSRTGQTVAWENCDNRVFDLKPTAVGGSIIVDGLSMADPCPLWRGAGTAIPVFSIRSEEDFGVGDFIDIKKMVDWCVRTGQKVLQLLPVNDTTMTRTWTDSYPYNANSTFALHPMYLRLQYVGTLKNPARREYYANLQKELNALEQIDYERVNNAKDEFMHEIFEEQGAVMLKSENYKKFVADNRAWLIPYAAFCVLRDLNGTPEMDKWGDMARYDAAKVGAFCEAHRAQIDFECFRQYHLDRQLSEARDYARQHGVVLKGDIPIGISRTSVDAWCFPHLFNMDSQAGAPPDDFSTLGQNWGFPTYNWDEMARDGFSWWKARFRKMAEYFDIYRIDHILGFFRIWQIPLDAIHGLLGVFNPALPLSSDEMERSFGFSIDVDLHTHPFIMHWMLGDFFGEYADEARDLFLEEIVDGRYRLKKFVDTQRKVVDYFGSREKSKKNEKLCNALLGLIDDVLFIEDPYRPGTYHPRIAAQYTYQYRYLDDNRKWCFNRLYDDFFYHRNTEFWREKAMQKLPPLLEATGMLSCGEDLGMIPSCVPEVMDRLKILSLEIQRMPKDPAEEFGSVWRYPYYSVCTTSTHDMPGIRAWWEADPARAQRYFTNVMGQSGASPFYAEPWVCASILNINLSAPSMFCILPLQDWMSADAVLRRKNPADEQINEPAISRHYWRYRMHLTVERLLEADAFNDSVLSMIDNSRRR